MNAATIAAIMAAVWAHPSGVSYLEKMDRLNACQTANPCCRRDGGTGRNDRHRHGDTRKRLSSRYEIPAEDRRHTKEKELTSIEQELVAVAPLLDENAHEGKETVALAEAQASAALKNARNDEALILIFLQI